MKAGDIFYYKNALGYIRFWEILSLCYGGIKQEDLIELRSLTERPGVDTNGKEHITTWVPAQLLLQNENITLYTKSIPHFVEPPKIGRVSTTAPPHQDVN